MKNMQSLQIQHALIGLFGLTAVLMLVLSSPSLFPVDQFQPHGHCFLWAPPLVFTFVVSDTLIALAYFAISLTLIYLVQKTRQDIPYNWMVLAFGMFIFACGVTHILDVWTLYYSDYWVSAGMRLMTALASVVTAVALPPLVPRLRKLVHDAKVSNQRKLQLERVVADLEREILERRKAEEAVRQLNADLEARVKERTEQLEIANNLKIRFLGMVSHELRTPLTVIKGFTSTLLAKDVQYDTQSQYQFLQLMDDEADKLANLVGQILDVSQMQAGALSITAKPMPLKNVIATAQAQLEALSQQHELVVDVPDDLPDVRADRQRIAQVIVNLVENSVKYSPPRTRITVAARVEGNAVRVSVRDQGRGISVEQRPLVFDAFQQSVKRFNSREGVGLGLTIAKGIIEGHGGMIWIEDTPGTTISFTLPVVGSS